MLGTTRSDGIQWMARCLSRVCARSLKRIGKPVDAIQRRELEADLATLLARYRDEGG